MKLGEILQDIKAEVFNVNVNDVINQIVFNSKKVNSGDVFICLRGVNTDGHEYCNEALKRGALAVIVDHKLDEEIPQIVVDDTRQVFSLISANFFQNVHKKLKLIGITGTNGKTTTTMIIRDILIASGKKVGVIGTLGYFIQEQNFECDLTTPDPMKLHGIFFEMYNKGVEYVIMEVSAHAIALDKIYGLTFEVGALTNITQDHLDFFETMDNYIKTKFKFMQSTQIKSKFLNADDESVHFLEDEMSFTYGIYQPSDCFAMDISLQMGKSKYLLNLFDNIIEVETKLSGEFNVYNVLLGSSICCMLGVDVNTIKSVICKIEPVTGRYNVISTNNGCIVIDFAHTPDGLENILKSIRQNCKKLICVFGCGGNRDSKKRPIMGSIVEKYATSAIITSDNPRFENPDLIAEDILEGIVDKTKFTVENDRTNAIKMAISKLDNDTVIAICGKGGEKYQDINGIMYPYDDNNIVMTILADLNIQTNNKFE